MKQRCNDCGGEYDDVTKTGGKYYHQCPPEVITHAVVNQTTGIVVTPEVRAPRPVIRDERPLKVDEKTVRPRQAGTGSTRI